MKEIANNIFIEQSYPGVVLCALKLSHGLLMVDAPFRVDDQLSWQQKLAHLGGGIGHLMVMLDTNTDRLYGMQLSEFPVLAQANSFEIIQNLPLNPRIPEMQARSNSESYDQAQNVRWRLPDITYSNQVSIHWDDEPVVITHQPGGHRAGSWVHYAAEKIIFIGDSVVIEQPPFLEWCDLDLWMEELTWLSSDHFKDYKIISGRSGEIQQESVLKMLDYLTRVKAHMDDLLGMEEPHEGIDRMAANLLSEFNIKMGMTEQYKSRVIWGLRQFLHQHKASQAED
jgi:hypothetical protein